MNFEWCGLACIQPMPPRCGQVHELCGILSCCIRGTCMRLDMAPKHMELLAFFFFALVVTIRDWHRGHAEAHSDDKRHERNERSRVRP